jgi:polyisoprenoid-binding protein YceI
MKSIILSYSDVGGGGRAAINICKSLQNFNVDTHVFVKKKTTNSNYLLKGFLVIKGVKKRVETTLAVTASKTEVRLLANFLLNRRDFGVGSNSFVLSDEVNIKMIYVASKK